MIDLTPLEVRQKKGDFRRTMRGYDPELVNDFLDLVADRMEELVKQNMALQDRVGTLGEDLKAFKDKERSLSDALLAAQKLREEARSHAEKEGELLVREARTAAETARNEVTRQLAREEDALRQVRARRGQLVESFRRLLERELSELTVIEQALDLEAPRTRAARPGAGPEAAGARPPEQTPAETGSETVSETGSKGKPQPGPRTAPGERPAEPRAARPRPKEQRSGESPPGDASQEAELQEDWLSSLVEEE